MKLYAQSQVPGPAPSYLHLGYAAAAAQNRKVGAFTTWMVCALLLGTAASVFWSRGHGTAKRRWWLSLLLLAGAAGTFALGFGVLEAGRLQVTRFNVMTLSSVIYLQLVGVNGGIDEPAPKNTEDLIRRFHLGDRDLLRDGWSRSLRVAREVQGERGRYVVTSAGRDGRFGTNDDFTRPTDWIALPEPESGQSAPEEATVRQAPGSDVGRDI